MATITRGLTIRRSLSSPQRQAVTSPGLGVSGHLAFLQLVRVYVTSLRRIAEAEIRLFHLYVHEPLIRDGVPELQMAQEMGDLAAEIMPLAAPLYGTYEELLRADGRDDLLAA